MREKLSDERGMSDGRGPMYEFTLPSGYGEQVITDGGGDAREKINV